MPRRTLLPRILTTTISIPSPIMIFSSRCLERTSIFNSFLVVIGVGIVSITWTYSISYLLATELTYLVLSEEVSKRRVKDGLGTRPALGKISSHFLRSQDYRDMSVGRIQSIMPDGLQLLGLSFRFRMGVEPDFLSCWNQLTS